MFCIKLLLTIGFRFARMHIIYFDCSNFVDLMRRKWNFWGNLNHAKKYWLTLLSFIRRGIEWRNRILLVVVGCYALLARVLHRLLRDLADRDHRARIPKCMIIFKRYYSTLPHVPWRDEQDEEQGHLKK